MGRRDLGYHLTAPANWMNDPNGPVWWHGRYHVFFQHNPAEPRWGPPHWAHASSADLVHWRHHPIALTPQPGSADADGCWSGCTRIVGDHAVIHYTGVVGLDDHDRVESVCRTVSRDPDLLEWTRQPADAVIPGPPEELGLGPHRDPFLFEDAGRWQMLLSTTIPGEHAPVGAVIHYRLDDTEAWRYQGVLIHGDEPNTPPGSLWECPQLIRFREQHALIVSVQDPDHAKPLRYAAYMVGSLEEQRFRAHRTGRLDHGDLFYAPAVMEDPAGRALTWGWIQEPLPPSHLDEVQHVGALTLPRELDLVDGELLVRPAAEVHNLRDTATPLISQTDAPSTLVTFEPPSQHWELEVVLPEASAGVDLELQGDVGGRRVRLDGETHQVELLDIATQEPPPDASVASLWSDGPTVLRVFVDRGVIELYFSNRLAMTTRLGAGAEAVITGRLSLSGSVGASATLHQLAAAIEPPG